MVCKIVLCCKALLLLLCAVPDKACLLPAGSLFGSTPGREMSAVPGLTSPQEWSRLQRTPSSFPTWPKPDYEREKELEREQERREQERERERE